MRSTADVAVLMLAAVLWTGQTLVPVQAEAGLFRVESDTLSSARNDDKQMLEWPIYEFLSTSYQSENGGVGLAADLSVFGEPNNGRRNFNLHLLNLSYAVAPDTLTLNVGRNFDVQRTIRSTTIDTAGFDLALFDKILRLGAFAGKERRLELNRWAPTATLMGAYAAYRSSSLFPLALKAKFQRREYERDSNVHENLLQFSGSKPFVGAWAPETLLDTEINVQTGLLNRLETGFDLFPNYKTALRTRLLTYELTPIDGIEQPIYSIFSQGRLYEMSVQGEYRFHSNFTGSLSVAYDNYVVQRPERTSGIKVETDLSYSWKVATFTDAVYVVRSFGGQLYGNRVVFEQSLTDRLRLVEILDYAYYDKITQSKRSAFNSQIGINDMLTDRLKINVGGEFNSNNSLRYDVRAFARLTYLLWTET